MDMCGCVHIHVHRHTFICIFYARRAAPHQFMHDLENRREGTTKAERPQKWVEGRPRQGQDKGKKAAWRPHGGLGGDLGTPKDKGKTWISSGRKRVN